MKKASPLPSAILILILIGLVFIFASSLTEAQASFNDPFFFIKKQLIWLILGFIAFQACYRLQITTIKNIASALYIISLVSLILVLLPQLSSQALGARRWLDLGFIGIQPSEIVKFTAIIYFSSLFSQTEKLTIKNLVIHLIPPFFLIIAQPNLSTAILIVAIAASIYYAAGGPILPLFTFCLIAALASIVLIFISPYRSARLSTLLNPQNDYTTSYHRNQIVYALASGGLTGTGFANSNQKYKFIPKISTDSILAVIAEETGFIGCLFIFFLYLKIINHLFYISQRQQNKFQSLVVAGIGCWIALQSLINIGAIVGLIPITGVPLPFISYGGSSLISLLAASGFAYNIESHE